MSRDEELDSEFRMMPPCICASFKHTNTHVHQRICPTFSLSVRSEDWGEGFVISIKFRSDLVKFPREEKKDRDSIGQERRVSSPRKPLEIIPTQVNCFQKALSSYLPPEWSSKKREWNVLYQDLWAVVFSTTGELLDSEQYHLQE